MKQSYVKYLVVGSISNGCRSAYKCNPGIIPLLALGLPVKVKFWISRLVLLLVSVGSIKIKIN